jgi:8-oxo-dGTP pyrophosphatase MutT (NUDIX family)
MRVVGCFLEYNNQFVVLYRHSHKPYGNTWGLPSGKVEPGEKNDEALIRELHEETGYRAQQSELELLGVFDFTSPTGTKTNYITYRVRLKEPHQIILEDAAHADFKWVTAEECYKMPDLIYGVADLLKMIGYVK